METQSPRTTAQPPPAAPPAAADLVEACRGGDQHAWDALIRRYRRLIYSVPSTVFRLDPADADEVFQIVVVKLYLGLSELRDARSLASWLISVARHECLRVIRRADRDRPLDAVASVGSAAVSPRALDDLHAIECEDALARAFERLERPSRQLLAALFVEEPTPTYEEISRRLGRPPGSLGPTRARALARLRELYLEEGGAVPAFDALAAGGLRRVS